MAGFVSSWFFPGTFVFSAPAIAADVFCTAAQDWASLHGVAGLRTFLAAQVAVPGQGVVGVLCLGSRCAGAFREASWGLLLAMVATGLVPLLGSPWLGGLSALAAGLADVASMDGFTGFAAGFLAGAGVLLGGVTNRHLGVRLGLLGTAGEELLLLQPSKDAPPSSSSCSTRLQCGGDMLLLTGEAAADSQLFGANGSFESGLPQVHMTRLASSSTLLLQAVRSSQPCSILDVQAAIEADRDAVPLDVLLADASEPLGSMLVVPLFTDSGRALGGLYLVHEEAGGLLEGGRLREQVAMLQQLLQQEIADMEVGLEEVQVSAQGGEATACAGDMSWRYDRLQQKGRAAGVGIAASCVGRCVGGDACLPDIISRSCMSVLRTSVRRPSSGILRQCCHFVVVM
jgi:hypothetical protein